MLFRSENSCNPVFIDVALRLGVEKYYDYFQKFGLLEKTGIDLPGEAGTIMPVSYTQLADHRLFSHNIPTVPPSD